MKDRVKSELDRRLDFIDFARVHLSLRYYGGGVGNLFDSIKDSYACATAPKSDDVLLTQICKWRLLITNRMTIG